MHKKSMFINSFMNVISLIITTIFAFVIRRFLIKYLGIEILGLNGVVVELINTLSLSELGVQTAVIFRLYEPVAHKDYVREGQIFTLFKKAYFIIGSVIFLLGIIMLPTLKYIIDLEISMSIVYAVYAIQLSTIVLSYYTCYYRVIYLVHEQQYFCSRIDILVQVVSYILQIFILVKYKNYYLFLLIEGIRVLVGNTFIRNQCKKQYEYIFEEFQVAERDKKNLFNDLKEIILGNVAGYVYSSTDSILISLFSGTIMVGLISNYKMITNAVRTLVGTINNSIAPTWGIYLQQEADIEKIRVNYNRYNLLQYIECCVLLVPIVCLADDFICLMFGEGLLVDSLILHLIIADIYIQNMHEPNAIIIRGKGLFHIDKTISIIATFVNFNFSIILASKYGVAGILIGTLLALSIFWVMRSWYVNKECKMGRAFYIKYWIINVLHCIEIGIYIYVSKKIISIISVQNVYVQFFLRGVAIEIVLVFFLVLLYGRTDVFKYCLERILKVKRRKR